MKKSIRIMIIALFSLLLIGCENNFVSKDEYNTLLSKYEELELKVKNLESLNDEYNTLINNNSNLSNEVTTLKNDLKSANNSIKELKGYKTKYNELNKKVEALSSNDESNNNIDPNNGIYTVVMHTDIGNIRYNDKKYIVVNRNGERTSYTNTFSDYYFNVQNGKTYGESFWAYSAGYTSGTGFPIATSNDLSRWHRYYISENNERILNFIGWFTEPNGKGTQIKWDTIVNLKSNITLYAYYETINCYRINYTFIYPNGIDTGTGIIDLDINSDLYSNISNINTLYDVEGIYTDAAMTNKLSSDYKVNKDLNIYIKYKNKE